MPSLRPFENLFHDWRYALRGLRHNPGFSTITVLTLTLGMGASIAILAVVNAVLIRPLPFPSADRLMAVAATTLGIPLVKGRGFDLRDTPEGAPVAIVNAAMARRFWPDSDPTGKRIRFYYDRDPQHWLTVVGVAADVRYHGLDSDPVPQVFVPERQQPYRSLPYPQAPFASLVLRTTTEPSALIPAMQSRIWAVDKDQPVLHIQSMEQALAESLADRRVYLLLLGFFAAAALLMALAGIYGVISYAVQRRTREMGIRFALGASAGQMLALVLRDGLALTFIGVAAGVIGAIALTRLLAGLLFGITATDPLTFVETAALFAGVALLATIVPARRAARIDPAVAFREE